MMASDGTIETLLKLRRQTLADAGRTMTDALALQTEAERALNDAEHAIAEQVDRASQPGPDDGAVEAFAAWLPGARRRAAAAQDRLDRATAGTSLARSALTLARAALEGVDALRDERRRAIEHDRARRDQHLADEMSRNLRVHGR